MTTLKQFGPSFRHITLELARDRNHPEGSKGEKYDILAPLDEQARIDPLVWKASQALCRVRHFRQGREDRIGRLRRKPGGQWYFDFAEGAEDDEIGFRFDAERFVTGEYVSVNGVLPISPDRSASLIGP